MSQNTTPDAGEIFADEDNPRPHEAISALTDAGLVTTKQAEAYVRRAILHEPRDAVADDMGIAPSTLDSHRGTAIERIETARETAAAIEAIEAAYEDIAP